MTEKDIERIANYLVAIRVMAERSNDENTAIICQLVGDCEVIIYREEVSDDD